ncbi:hypothetical protein T492DRAFT_889799 [Pavlovales sp. CCMP2436]|nr:hypothetical protein T492DRAFT_889799 [Pavlovales sp. CCMP2436]
MSDASLSGDELPLGQMQNLALHGDAWDDTALIQAYDEAVDSFQRAHGGTDGRGRGKPKKRADAVDAARPARESPAHTPASANGTRAQREAAREPAREPVRRRADKAAAALSGSALAADGATRERGQGGDGDDHAAQWAAYYREHAASGNQWHGYGAQGNEGAAAGTQDGQWAPTGNPSGWGQPAQASWPPGYSYCAYPQQQQQQQPQQQYSPYAWGSAQASPYAGAPLQQQQQWAQTPSGGPTWPVPSMRPTATPGGPRGAEPPMPEGASPDLANLLLSWYYSGYYTGRYNALHESPK